MRVLSGSRMLLSACSAVRLRSLPLREVLKIVVNDTIHPITDEYIGRALAEAERNKDQALLIELNTPGGLLDSTRDIIEKILASPVPVIIYVTPSGSRAASAGFFILESADVAAMAPGTNTGAAHPVTLGGGKVDDVMKEKMENDAAALMRSVVSKRGPQRRSGREHGAPVEIIYRSGGAFPEVDRLRGDQRTGPAAADAGEDRQALRREDDHAQPGRRNRSGRST